jgi:hypothetical protein
MKNKKERIVSFYYRMPGLLNIRLKNPIGTYCYFPCLIASSESIKKEERNKGAPVSVLDGGAGEGAEAR